MARMFGKNWRENLIEGHAQDSKFTTKKPPFHMKAALYTLLSREQNFPFDPRYTRLRSGQKFRQELTQ